MRGSVIVIISGRVTLEMFDRCYTIDRGDARPYYDCDIIRKER